MNLAELTALIYAAGDCTVTFTTINVPDMSRGKMYGVVTYGPNESKRTFHDEEELRDIMGRIGR